MNARQQVEIPPHQHQLLLWSGNMSVWIAEVIDLCRPLLGPKAALADDVKLVLWQLAASCHSTSESALLLVGNVRLWDADVLVRSVVEGSFKFLFLTSGDEDERRQKFREFDTDFSAMGRLRRHTRLEGLLRLLSDANADEWRPFRDMLLPAETVAQLQQQYPRKFRHRLEQKWSFAEICAWLNRSPIKAFHHLGHMLFNYGMTSHVAHQDIDGIGMVWDRNGRNAVRREAIELAHGGRLVSDVCVMAWLRAYALFALTDTDKTPLKTLNERLAELHRQTAEAASRFHQVEYSEPTGRSEP